MDDARALLAAVGLSQTAAAKLLGIDDRTMRRYCDRPDAPGYRKLPEPIRRMLLLIGAVPGVREWLASTTKEQAGNAECLTPESESV